jgi:hypothetical protein
MLRNALGRIAVLLVATLYGAALAAAEPGPLSANTRMMQAIWDRDHDALAAVLREGASPNYVAPYSEVKAHVGGPAWSLYPDRLVSALGLAARWGDIPSMDLLLESGVDVNLHARLSESNLPSSNPRASLEMTKQLIQRGYRPTAFDINTALGLRGNAGWDEWAKTVLDAPGVARRIANIEASTDPEFQRLLAEQKADQDRSQQKTEMESLEGQVQAAQEAQQAIQDQQALLGAGVGDLVCSVPGKYKTKYVARVAARNGDRIELRIIGGFNRALSDFKPDQMRWDDSVNWFPCHLR